MRKLASPSPRHGEEASGLSFAAGAAMAGASSLGSPRAGGGGALAPPSPGKALFLSALRGEVNPGLAMAASPRHQGKAPPLDFSTSFPGQAAPPSAAKATAKQPHGHTDFPPQAQDHFNAGAFGAFERRLSGNPFGEF
mmetsp:Transcript_34138/g.77137  ORF Transcript_34138/g.77137 Transcript_34138/m.77137 type:complete len:138 (+) Transcript_34138:962-1375(+)